MPYAKQTEAAESVFDRNRRREAEINDGLKQAKTCTACDSCACNVAKARNWRRDRSYLATFHCAPPYPRFNDRSRIAVRNF
jgi:hypothetical protein